MANKAKTSAGVYKTDGTLVRTLWSLVNYSKGEHTEKWDGLLDDGTPAPKDTYQVKVLSSDVNYQWEGAVIGNTSKALTGNTKLRFFDPLYGMAVAKNNIYWAAGYNEGWPANYKTSINNPNSKTWIGPLKQTNQMTTLVCTDGELVYWAGHDPLDSNYESFVFATKIADDKRVIFANGVNAKMEWGSTYQSVISYKNTPKSEASLITGISVQNNGNYLFVSRKGLNELQVLNKTTGALVHKITIASPSAMQVDRQNNLWLAHGNAVEKYTVDINGSIASAHIIIPLSNVGAISVSPDNAKVIFADISTEQVKAYSNKTGSFLWALGSSESYITNSTVKDNKFYWKDIRMEYATFLCYMPDGTFYVGDLQNRRVQHYANRTFIDKIMYLPASYSTVVDLNNPARVFADFLEFRIDYSKPLAASNGSWTLIRNWGANVSNDCDLFEKMRFIVTLNNGRTYARLKKKNDYTIIELVYEGSVRFTDIRLPQFGFLDKYGSKIVSTQPLLGYSQALEKFDLNGFDKLNNPIWSDTAKTLAITPPITSTDPISWEGWRAEPFTSSGQIIFFDYSKAQNGRGERYHLGSIKTNSNQWLWKTAQSTSNDYTGPFPIDGNFDSGNHVNYPGGVALIFERNIFWSYHGENWKQSQTNIWNHVYDNGLIAGQFGELNIDHPNEEAFAGGAGNVFTGNVVNVNGETYLYHNDESVHGAVHRWHITGLNTIQVQTAIYPSSKNAAPLEGIDLLQGLTRRTSLVNGFAGWERAPITDYDNAHDDFFSAEIGNKKNNIFQSPDLFISCALLWASPGTTASIIRTLLNNDVLSSWKLWGQVLFDINTPNEPSIPSRGGSYIEILDKNNKIITRFFIKRNAQSGTDVIGNDQIIYHTNGFDLQVANSKYQPIEISAMNGLITFKYANYKSLSTHKLIDSGADWRRPSKLRFFFFTNVSADNYTRSIDISEMRFSKNIAADSVFSATAVKKNGK